eukprot:226728_1
MAYKYITFTVDGNAHRKRFTVEALQTFDGFKQALVTKMNEEIAAEQKDAGDEEIVFVIRDLAYMLDGVEVTINIAADWDDLWADVSRQDNPMPMPRFNLNNREERRAIADRARAERERAQANAREREQLAATEAQRVQEALKREKEKRFRALCTTIQSNKLMIFDDKKDNIEYFQIQYKQYADNNHITTEETNRMLINGTILSSDAFRYLQTTVGAQQNCDYWAILIERYKKPSSIHRLRVAISELGIKNNESVRDFMNRFTQLTSDLSMEVQIQTKAGFKYEQMDEFAKSREFLKALCRAPRGVAIADKLIIAATTKHQSPEIKFSQLILIVNEIIAGEDYINSLVTHRKKASIHNVNNFDEIEQKQSTNQQLCFKCGQPGHYARSCPTNARNFDCFNCGKRGHRAYDCKAPRNAARIQKQLATYRRNNSWRKKGDKTKNIAAFQAKSNSVLTPQNATEPPQNGTEPPTPPTDALTQLFIGGVLTNEPLRLQTTDSLPLQTNEPLRLQTNDSLPLQTNEPLRLQTNDSLPLQTNEPLRLQTTTQTSDVNNAKTNHRTHRSESKSNEKDTLTDPLKVSWSVSTQTMMNDLDKERVKELIIDPSAGHHRLVSNIFTSPPAICGDYRIWQTSIDITAFMDIGADVSLCNQKVYDQLQMFQEKRKRGTGIWTNGYDGSGSRLLSKSLTIPIKLAIFNWKSGTTHYQPR